MRERLRKWGPVVAIFAAIVAVCGTAGFMITSSHGGRPNATTPAAAGTTSSIGVVTLPVSSSSPSRVVTSSPATATTTASSAPSSSPSSIATTTSPATGDDGLSLPEAVYSQVTGAYRQTIFGRSMPIPATWDGTMSDAGASNFADMTTCNDATAGCPHVMIIDLTNGLQNTQFGTDDPARKWLDLASCATGDKQPVQGPATGVIHGQRVQYFVQHCGLDPYATPNLVWYFPDLKLMMVGQSGPNGSLSPGTMRAVLEDTTW